MTEKARKREKIESVAEKFILLSESDKSYITGYINGILSERKNWEDKMTPEILSVIGGVPGAI